MIWYDNFLTERYFRNDVYPFKVNFSLALKQRRELSYFARVTCVCLALIRSGVGIDSGRK